MLTNLAHASKGLPVLGILMTCAGYYLGGVIGIKLIFPSSNIAILWPSNAILLAALLLSPVRTWWIYILAVFPTHLHLVSIFQAGVPVPVMLSQAFGNSVQAAAGAAAVRFVSEPPQRLDNLRSMTAFMVLAVIAAPGLAAVVAAYLFILTGWAADFWSTWRLRFLANPFAILSITPLILQADADWFRAIREAPLRRYLEFGLLQIGLLLVSIAVFGQEGSDPTLLYAPLPLLLWAAVRFGLSGLCASLLVVAFLSLSNAIAGRGPFLIQSPVENSRSLQIFLMTVSVPLMLLCVLLEERRRIADALRASFHDVRQLAGQLISAQEGERTRIARDLHDDIGQRVASFAIALSRAKRQIPDASSPAGKTLADLQQQAMQLSNGPSPPLARPPPERARTSRPGAGAAGTMPRVQRGEQRGRAVRRVRRVAGRVRRGGVVPLPRGAGRLAQRGDARSGSAGHCLARSAERPSPVGGHR